MEANIFAVVHPAPNAAVTSTPEGLRATPPPADPSPPYPSFPIPWGGVTPLDASVGAVAAALGPAVDAFAGGRQSAVFFAVGTRDTPRRAWMVGGPSSQGYAALAIGAAVAKTAGVAMLQAYIVGPTDALVDALEPGNTEAVLTESAKLGPRLRGLSRKTVKSPGEVSEAFQGIAATVQKHFSPAETPNEALLPPYNGDTVVVTLLRYESEEMSDENQEVNSMNFIAVGDTDRPTLCGIDRAQLASYESAQKILTGAVSITSAIRCSRLRIPFTKSRLTTLLRRAYNQERGNPHNDVNGPTTTSLLFHISAQPSTFEETAHNAALMRRVAGSAGLVGGLPTRDVGLERWRLDAEAVELREEVAIARAAFDYKPSIVDTPRPIANVAEEETKRTAAVLRRREEERERTAAEVRAAALAEVERYIAEHEERAEVKMGEMEQRLQQKRAEAETIIAEKNRKLREQERHLEKIRKKKEEEERAATKLKEEIRVLEAELEERKESLQRQKQELHTLTNAQAAGREQKQQEREALRRRQEASAAQRKQQREAWLKNITQANEKILSLVRQVEEDRVNNPNAAIPAAADTEEQLRADVESIEGYLRKVLALEGTPGDAEGAESIRRQLEAYFAEERKQYRARIADLETKRAKIEVALHNYKSKATEQQAERRKERLAEATKKEQHLATLTEQVLLYLQHGVRMTKVSSQGNLRRRFFYLSSDFKRLHACDLDEAGMPMNRKKPTVTVYLKDIKRVVLGAYTPSFATYAGDAQLAAGRATAFTPTGTGNTDSTSTITPSTLGRLTYRCFGLLLRGGKSLEVVCDSDSDFEAWVIAFKRCLGYKTPLEMRRAREENNEGRVEIGWGSSASLRGIAGVDTLLPEEAHFCSLHHVPPLIYTNCKKDILLRAQSHVVTTYDVRMVSSLDLFRSQMLLEFLIESKALTQ